MRFGIVCTSMAASKHHLQPWRYVHELARGLQAAGHSVTIVTDVASGKAGEVDHVWVPSVRRPIYGNPSLARALKRIEPDVTLWHTGLTSALHFSSVGLSGRNVAILTSPVHSLPTLLRLGPKRLWLMRADAWVHLAGSAIPRSLIKRLLLGFDAVVTLSASNRDLLRQLGVEEHRIIHAPPGVDEPFLRREAPPASWGDHVTLLYAGSLRPVRGIEDLVAAMARSQWAPGRLRLRILARSDGPDASHLWRSYAALSPEQVSVREGLLSREQVADEMRAAHVVALPFRIVPSDVPLTMLEALAMGRPVLGTRIGCMREYVGDEAGALAEPGNVARLAEGIRMLAVDRQRYLRACAAAVRIGRTLPRWSSVARTVLNHPIMR